MRHHTKFLNAKSILKNDTKKWFKFHSYKHIISMIAKNVKNLKVLILHNLVKIQIKNTVRLKIVPMITKNKEYAPKIFNKVLFHSSFIFNISYF